MAHTAQDRYAKLVDAKLRNTLSVHQLCITVLCKAGGR